MLLALLGSPGVVWADRVPGGGKAKSDCYAEFDVQGAGPSNKMRCMDGDPCDADGKCDGVCTFRARMCVNQSDIATCSSTALKRAPKVTKKLLTVPSFTGAVCGDYTDIPVRLKGKKKTKKGALKVMVTALSASSKPVKDEDTLNFSCVKRVGDCPTTTTTTLPPLPFTKLSFTTTVGSTSCGGPSFVAFVPPAAPFSGEVDDGSNAKIGDLGLGCLYVGGASAATPANQIPDAAQSLFELGTPSGGDVPLIASTGTGRGNCTKGAGPGKHCIAGNGGPIACTSDADCGGTGGSCALDANCFFGPPLPITGVLPVCVMNAIITDASGTAQPGTGDSTVDIPLSSRVYLTANATDPCPKCIAGQCDPSWRDGGGNPSPNAGAACTPVGTQQTSLDCGVPLGDFQGALAVELNPLTTGPASKTDAAGNFCPGQTHAGAFHLVAARTIKETGSPAGNILDGAEHSSILASVFCIPASLSAAINTVGDLPGPGAIGLVGNAQLVP